MAKYAYPAIFTKEDNAYTVLFPDISGCITSGDSKPDAIEMAEDALGLLLCEFEDDESEIPEPSEPKDISVDENSFVTLIACDTIEYRKTYDNKAVKKTLTIPNWLNSKCERAGLNFSQILQEALIHKLNIN